MRGLLVVGAVIIGAMTSFNIASAEPTQEVRDKACKRAGALSMDDALAAIVSSTLPYGTKMFRIASFAREVADEAKGLPALDPIGTAGGDEVPDYEKFDGVLFDLLKTTEPTIAIYRSDGQRALFEVDKNAFIDALLLRVPGKFRIVCQNASSPESDDNAGSRPGNNLNKAASYFVAAISKTPEDLTKNYEDKPVGEFSYTNDAAAGSTSYGFNFAAGLVHGHDGDPLKESIFVEVNRTGSDPEEPSDTNDISLGLGVGGHFQIPALFGTPEERQEPAEAFYSLTTKFTTDNRFRSEEYSGMLTLSPDLGYATNDCWKRACTLSGTENDGIGFDFDHEVIVDYVDVADPGTKTSLIGKPQFFRVGYSLASELIWRRGGEDFVNLKASYEARYDLSGNGGDANLLTVALAKELDKEGHFNFGLSYTRGREFDSLAPKELTELTLGVRYGD